MSYTLVFRGAAAQDAFKAFVRYHSIRPSLGDRFFASLREVYDQIQDNPFSFQVRKGGFRHGFLRKFPYRVVYEVEGQEVFIYRIHHTRRRPSRKFGP